MNADRIHLAGTIDLRLLTSVSERERSSKFRIKAGRLLLDELSNQASSPQCALSGRTNPSSISHAPHSWRIVLAGEIYNLHRSRSNQLSRLSLEKTPLIEGFRISGLGFLPSLDGRFVGLALNEECGLIALFRDRFGSIPLYWRIAHHQFEFTSELQSFSPRNWNESPPEVILSLLTSYGLPHFSSNANIFQLIPPGTLTLVDRSSSVTHVPYIDTCEVQSKQTASIAKLQASLTSSASSRIDPGSTAVAISGGIDSSIIGKIAADLGVVSSIGLSIGENDPNIDLQLETAHRIGLKHQSVTLTPSTVLKEFECFVQTRRMPLTRLGPIGMAILGSHLGKTYCHTLLTGEGADELFFGYDQFRIALAQQGHFGNLTDLDWSSFGHPEFSLGGKDPRIHWKTLIALTSRQSIVPLPNVKPYLRFDPDMLQRRSEPQSEGHDLRKNLIMGILSSYLLPVQAYAALSWYGIDSRSPYLSTEVARWAFSRKIQDEVSITGGKQSLRALLAHLKTADGRSLASLVRPKQAYRVETDLVRSSEYAWERLVSLAGSCSNPLLRADVVVRRAKSLPLTSSVPESLSMMLILCASLAILES